MTFHIIAIELTLAGLLLGGIYAILAVGLTMTFGVARIINLAHGEFLMLSTLAAYLFFTATDGLFNPFLSLFIIFPLFFAVGYHFDKILIKPLRVKLFEGNESAPILVTLGLALLIEDLSSFVISREYGVSFALSPIKLAAITLSGTRTLSLIIVAITVLVLHLFLKRTFTGKAIRAAVQDNEAAATMGIDVNKLSALTFGIGIALASIAGIFLVMIESTTTYIGLPLTAKAVAIVILGGLGSVIGSLVGAVILGLAEVYVSFFISPAWSFTVAWIVLIIILIARPYGLFGKLAQRI